MSYAELRVEVLSVAFGFVLFAGGLLFLLLPVLYRSAKNPALATFGAGVSLHGALALARLLSVRAAAGLPDGFWEYAVPCGMYFEPVLAFRFAELYWGAGRFAAFRRIWQVHLAFAIGAAAVELVTGAPGTALAAHLVLAFRVDDRLPAASRRRRHPAQARGRRHAVRIGDPGPRRCSTTSSRTSAPCPGAPACCRWRR